jgi:hypothetical protein
MLNMCFASGGIRESPSVLWCVRGMKHRCTIFLARVGLVRIPEKACRDTLHQTFICASGGISRSHSAFCASSVRNIKAWRDTLLQTFFGSVWICGLCSALRCVWGVKQRRTIFLARVAPVRIPQKMHRDTLCQTCVFLSGGICGSRSAFWCLGTGAVSIKVRRDWLRRTCIFASGGIWRVT